jgi:hypothetical protein
LCNKWRMKHTKELSNFSLELLIRTRKSLGKYQISKKKNDDEHVVRAFLFWIHVAPFAFTQFDASSGCERPQKKKAEK